MYASHHIIGLSPDDVVYCHLPMYHSSGGQVATCSSILFGTKTVIRRKFSASAFWKDCVGFNITVSNYNHHYQVRRRVCKSMGGKQ